MSTVCPKCGHERTADEIVTNSECPRCAIVYAESVDRTEPPAPPPAAASSAPVGPDEAALEGLHEEAPLSPVARFQGQWRLVALVLALLLVVVAAALTTRQRSVTGGAAAWDEFPFDIRGSWEGRVVETIDLRGRPPYEAEYSARFVVDEQFRLVELEWTAGHFLAKKETVLWQWPATIAYTSQRRSGISESFVEPPRGFYTQVALDRGNLFLGTRHDGSSSLPFLETDLRLTAETPRDLWSNGGFTALRGEGAIEAIARGGIPRIDRAELDREETQIELPDAAPAMAFRPYLRGAKPWPNGPPGDPREPYAGLELEEMSVVDLPEIVCSVAPVEARLTGNYRRPGEEPEPLEGDWAALMPESRLHLSIRRPIVWSAHVVFHPDGHAVVRLPHRDLEIPVERIGDAPVAQQLDPHER